MEESISEIDYLKAIYSQARKKYRPHDIRVIIIAEAPPCALDRFFYFDDVKKQDSLFLEIMGILYPGLKDQYLSSGRETEIKKDLLERFKSDGYWLLDLYEIPTNISGDPSNSDVQSLIARLENLITKDVPIILIKANVYDVCYNLLESAGYRVINVRMPFPGSGQQKLFREKFGSALQICS